MKMSRLKHISKCRNDLSHIYNQALKAIKPDKLVRDAISIKGNSLTIKQKYGRNLSIDLADSNIHLIGGGKSVMGMACGLAQLAIESGTNHLFSHGCLSLPVGLKMILEADEQNRKLLGAIKVDCLFGSENNLPDANSIMASQNIIQKVSIACQADSTQRKTPVFVVLISGGGSACLTSPRFIDLDKKLELISFLVQRGAEIIDLNKVRRYFSYIKGGQLAQHILKSHPNSKIISLIMSDVIGDPIEYIASGPTCLDSGSQTDHRQAMIEVLDKYGYPSKDIVRLCKDEIELPIRTSDRIMSHHVIGNNKVALDACVESAKFLGYKVEFLGDNLQGFTDDIVGKITARGDELYNEKSNLKSAILVVGGGEAVVRKSADESWGKGGRAQEMALDYIIPRLKTGEKERSTVVDFFLAGGTDGQDGPTDVAACFASAAEYHLPNESHRFTLDDALESKKLHDSYNFWSKHKPNWLIKTGLTGTNVMDLYLYLLSSQV